LKLSETQRNPTHKKLKFYDPTQRNAIQPNPTEPNPWMDRTVRCRCPSSVWNSTRPHTCKPGADGDFEDDSGT